MNFNVEIGFNSTALTAISELTQAIRALAPAQIVVEKPVVKAAETTKPKVEQQEPETPEAAEPETIYWFDSAADEVGTVEGEDAFKALKKKRAKLVKFTKSKYDAKVAELEAKAAAAQEEQEEPETDDEPPSVDDVIEVFSSYLPTTLDKAERDERVAFVKPLLERFGAKKATELAEQHRKLAINLVKRKMAGEDIDPTSSKFAEVCEEEESLV